MAAAVRVRHLLLPFCVMVFATSAYGQIDATVLKQIKDATVLIKAGKGDKASTGSGFVVSSDRTHSLIVTNAHVIQEHLKPNSNTRVECVVNSGQPNETSLTAEIHAVSLVDDLALLKSHSLRNAATIEADGSIVPIETQHVFAAGFPFGEMLSVGDRNPNVTITETSITSVRQSSSGMPEALQTSGGIDPGNSGGPVVDQSGRLVGVSVAKMRESSIGFAIPSWKVQELLPPSMSDVLLTKKPGEGGYRCSVSLTGLKHSGGTQIPVLVGMKYDDEATVQSTFSDGSWSEIPGLKVVRIAMLSDDPDVPYRKQTVRIDLDQIQGTGDRYVLQWRLQTGPNRNSTAVEYRYSRPLYISREDIEAVENAMASGPTPSSEAPGSGQADGPDETVLQFDAYVRRSISAGDGKYLVVWLANEDIVVVDLSTKQQVAKINESSVDSLVAGRNSVIAFNKSERTMTSYRLPDLQVAGTKTIRDKPIVRFADWGASATGPIAAVIQPSGAKVLSCVLIDPGSGKVSRFSLEGEKRQRGKPPETFLDAMPTSGDFELRMNDTGNVVTLWLNNTNRPQVHVIRKGRRQWSHEFFSEGAAYGYPSPTGKATFSAEAVLADDLGILHEAALCLPTTHDDYFLTLGSIVMADPNAPRTGPTTSYDRSVKHVDRFTWHLASVSDANVHRSWTFRGDLNDQVLLRPANQGIPLDERFMCVPKYNVLAAVLPEAMRGGSKRLRLYDLGERLPNVGAPSAVQSTAVSATDEKAVRTWTDKTGRFTLEASVVAVKQGYVKLQKKDGSTVVLQISKLSSADQDWLRKNSQ